MSLPLLSRPTDHVLYRSAALVLSHIYLQKDHHASFDRQNVQLRLVVFAVHKLDRVCQIGTHDHEKGKL